MASESFARAEAFLSENDRERYLTTLVLPAAARPGIVALYAFSADVALVRARVSAPAPGEIRLQWWADALSGEGHGEVRRNPLADALLDTLARYRLPVGTLQRLIAARRFDLYDDPMPDLDSFTGYAGETVSTLVQLAAMILNGGEPVASGDAAGHLGVAEALAGHMRAFGYNAARGRIVLPWSVLAANGVTEAEVFSGTVSEGLVEAMGQFHDMARERLELAEAALALLPARLRPAYAGLALVRAHLDRLRRSPAGPFVPPPGIADWRKIARLAWWAWRHRQAPRPSPRGPSAPGR